MKAELDAERLATADRDHQAGDNCTHQDYRRECAPLIAWRYATLVRHEHRWVRGWLKNENLPEHVRWTVTQQWPDDVEWIGCEVCELPKAAIPLGLTGVLHLA